MKKNLLVGLGVIVAIVTMQFVQTEIQASLFDRLTPCAEVGECNPCDEVATSDCDPCGEVDDACYKKKSKWFVNGYLEAGFFANEYGQKSQYLPNVPNQPYPERKLVPWSGNTSYLQNVANTGGQLNQLYISAGRAVDGKHGLDIGGTVDFTFGTDARFVQAAGFEFQYVDYNGGTELDKQWGSGDYYSAFAQAFIELEYKRWNVKVGKVYAPFGSNSYKSTDRFFYSLADTYGMVPATALAAYATYTVNNRFSIYGGWAQPDQFGETSEDNAFLFGFNWQASKRLHIAYALGSGKNERFSTVANPNNDIEYFVQSLVTTYKINSKLTSIFDWSLYNISYEQTPPDTNVHSGIYGINTELIYQYNCRWAFGFRAGWGRDINDFRYNGDLGYDNKYTFSIGANWTPVKWLIVKSELRYDKFEDTKAFNTLLDNGGGAGRDQKERKTDQFAGGVSAIVKF
ncbi:MAG: porin [Planctomycetaceae bacterium]|nr:porin [Planctomycetaceae bacterium]